MSLWGLLTGSGTRVALMISMAAPPVLTALWIGFVRLNNRYSLRQIDPQPWFTLFKLYLLVIFLTAMDLFAK